MSRYVSERRKLFRSIADYCHDKAVDAIFPATAAEWAIVADNCLWAAFDPDGTTDPLESYAVKARSTVVRFAPEQSS